MRNQALISSIGVLASRVVAGALAVCPVIAALFLPSGHAAAQVVDSDTNILNDVTTFSPYDLKVSRYVTIPGADQRINAVTLRPGDSDAFYTTSQTGVVYRVTGNGSGGGDATEWFDAKDGGFFANVGGNTHGGMRSIAFHPDFADPTKGGYGKLYASFSSSTKAQAWSAPLIGSTTANGNPEGVVAEWTYHFGTGQVDQSSYRELFRVSNSPRFDHPIKSLSFNTAARQTDGDYGLLYIGYGDAASSQEFGGNAFGSGQDLTNALGKVLRINPLGSSTGDYTTPGNTYSEDGDANTLAEIYSAGHRNPHHLTFARAAGGGTKLIVGEVGQDLVEEVNVIDINVNTNGQSNGFDYGWGVREGTFVRRLGDGGYGVQQTDLGNTNPSGPQGSAELLPSDDAGNGFIYPSLQIDHNDPGDVRNSDAIAGGHVVDGRYVFGNFSGNSSSLGGQIYSADIDELLGQKTSLGPGEDPADLTWIDDLVQHRLLFDHDDNPSTDDEVYDTFADLLTADIGSTQYRTDFRFGLTPDGRLVISSKRNGGVYIVESVVPEPGSFAFLGVVGLLLAVRRGRRW